MRHNIGTIFKPLLAFAFGGFVMMSAMAPASAEDVQKPSDSPNGPHSNFGADVPAALEKAANNATLWVLSNGAVVHFKDGDGTVHYGYLDSDKTMKDDRWSSIDEVIPNTAKVRTPHSPDAVLVVRTTGSTIGDIQMIDLVAVHFRHGKVTFGAQYKLDTRVLGANVTAVSLDGDTIKATYYTPGPNEALCCGTVENNVTLRYNGKVNLVLESPQKLQPRLGSSTAVQHQPGVDVSPGAAPSAAMQKAAENATLWVKSNGGVVHFKKSDGRTSFGYRDGIKDESWSHIDWVIPNTAKVRSPHSPDAVLVVTTGGSLTGQMEWIDLIAVNFRHGKITFAAQYQLHEEVTGVIVSNVALDGDTIKATYLTPGPTDPLCCGTVENLVTLHYNGSVNLVRQ